MELERNEALVLKAIVDGHEYSLGELVEKTRLALPAVVKAIEGLKKYGLVSVREEKSSEYSLTNEGELSLREGLVERKLVRELIDAGGNKKVEDIETQPKEVAIGWAIRKGWVRIEGEGKEKSVVLTDKGKEHAETPDEMELALEKIRKGEDVDRKILEMLRKRGLIELEEKVERFVRITGRGAEKAREIKEIKEEITALTPEIIRTGKWKHAEIKRYDVKDPVREIYPAKKQPYRAFLDEVKRKLVSMGFKEMEGPLIELEFWNFDALFQPQNHPARTWTDTYRLKYPSHGRLPSKKLVERVKKTHENGWKTGSKGWGYKWSEEIASRLMPRAQGTALSARTLASLPEIPGKYFAIARCYRPDKLDATHLIEFNQVEGIVIGKGLNFRHILGILKKFAVEVARAEDVRFYPDYYPFTEPSVQLSAKHPELGWVELGGAGIFREEVTKPLGIDVPVIACGLGIDRLAMFKLGIRDIRYLFSYDLKWIRKHSSIITL